MLTVHGLERSEHGDAVNAGWLSRRPDL